MSRRLQRPPGPHSAIPGKLLFEFVKNPLTFLQRAAQADSDVVYFRLGGRSRYLLRRPDDIKDVLLTHSANFTIGYVLEKARIVMGEGLVNSEGPLHGRQRRLVQRSFNKQRIAGYATTMAAYAQELSSSWHDGQETDIHQDIVRLSLNIVMKTLFNTDAGVDAKELGAHFKVILENSLLLYILPYPEKLLRLPIPRLRAIVRGMNYLDATIYRMIAERRRSGSDEGDLLSAFIGARDIDGDGEGMSDRQIRDECVSAFAAGHETTANAVAWCLYLLARHPDVAEKMDREINAVLGNRAPAFDDYPRLPYTKMVLSESMRLYPPAWHISRRALQDYDVGGYTIPARSLVLINPWLMHRDARYFPDPERFDPERFAPGTQPSWPPYCYLPFGAGVRGCVGEGFAWLAGVTILAVLVRDWTFHLKNDRPVEPAPLMIVRPKGGLPMILRKRTRGTEAGRG